MKTSSSRSLVVRSMVVVAVVVRAFQAAYPSQTSTRAPIAIPTRPLAARPVARLVGVPQQALGLLPSPWSRSKPFWEGEIVRMYEDMMIQRLNEEKLEKVVGGKKHTGCTADSTRRVSNT